MSRKHTPHNTPIPVPDIPPTQYMEDSDSEENDPEYIQMLKDIKEIKEQAEKAGEDIRIIKMTLIPPTPQGLPKPQIKLQELPAHQNGSSPNIEMKTTQ